MKCLFCEKPLAVRRRTKKYCDAVCRVYASRRVSVTDGDSVTEYPVESYAKIEIPITDQPPNETPKVYKIGCARHGLINCRLGTCQ